MMLYPGAFLFGSGARLVSSCRVPASLYNWNPKKHKGNFGIIKLGILIICILGNPMFYNYDEQKEVDHYAEVTVKRASIQYKVNNLHLVHDPPNILHYNNVQRANVQDYRAVIGRIKKIGPIPRTMQLLRQLYNSLLSSVTEPTPIHDPPIYATWRRNPKDKHYEPTNYNYCCGYYPVMPEPAGRDSNYINITTTTRPVFQERPKERRLRSETRTLPRYKIIREHLFIIIMIIPTASMFALTMCMIAAGRRSSSHHHHGHRSRHHGHHRSHGRPYHRARSESHERNRLPHSTTYHYRVPPSWNPAEAHRYSFRAWRQGMQIWVSYDRSERTTTSSSNLYVS